jgi:hypothetical protein
MARITVVLCDVRPCSLPAEREFDLNGKKVYVCGEHCFVKFWSREYGNWKESRYSMQTMFQDPKNPGITDPFNTGAEDLRTRWELVKPS